MTLSHKQRQAVECESNCLVLACPGSGKTRVLVHKSEFLHKLDPGGKIMIVTFTKDSANEIRRRVVEQIGPQGARKIASGTFHSIALDQLKRAGFNGRVIGPGQTRQYIERALSESNLLDFDVDEAEAFIQTAKSMPDFEPGNDVHGKIFMEYVKLCERNNVIDFADMLARTVRMMKSEEIRPKDISYLLTDESQDMDEMQYAWCVEHINNGAKFTVVGDDDQSIYKFRRAMGYAGMMRFHDDFGAKIIKLDSNYRSYAEILLPSASLISNNQNRVDKNLVAERGNGGSVEAFKFKEPDEEAQFVANKIAELCAANSAQDQLDSIRINPGEWAILARNSHNLTEISMALTALGIPYTSVVSNLWAERPICLALGLLASLLDNKKAGFDAALHYAGIDEDTLIKLHDELGDDFGEVFSSGNSAYFKKFGAGTGKSLAKMSKLVKRWKSGLGKQRVSIVIRGVFDWFIENLDANRGDGKAKGSYQREFRKLRAARRILGDMNGDLASRIATVLGSDKNEDKNRNEDHEEGKVFLGSMHSSKGLEFKNVWLLSMDDGVIPDLKEWTPETHEEERRLFYVGMTRAKDRLFISCCKNPSSFILETGIPVKQICWQSAEESESSHEHQDEVHV